MNLKRTIQKMQSDIKARQKVTMKKELLTKINKFMQTSITEIYSKEIISVSPKDTMLKAAQAMKTAHRGSVMVMDGKKALGILAESDFLKIEFTAQALNSPVDSHMSTSVESVKPTSTIREAHEIMLRHGYRKIAVMKDDQLLGVITQTDIVKAFDKFAIHTSIEAESLGLIRDIMSTNILVASKGTKASDARYKMLSGHQNSILVIEDKKPVGIITTKDFMIQMIANVERLNKLDVEMMMSGNLATLDPGITVFEANKLMLQPELNFRRFPVMEGNTLVGIVSQTDISRGIMEVMQEIKQDLAEGKVSDINVEKEYLNQKKKQEPETIY